MPEDNEGYQFERVLAAALAGLGTVVVTQLLQVASLDAALKIALYCFAISIPMLAAYWFILLGKAGNMSHFGLPEMITMVVGLWSGVIGLGAIFWHFSTRL